MSNSVTVTMLTYNDEKILPECLDSIRRQEYNGKVNILLLDGGSTDKTLEIAKKFNATVMSKSGLKKSPHKRLELGLSSINTDIIVLFSADNRFQENNCLSEMIKPFEKEYIAMVETFRYGFFEHSSMLTKYFALIGGADPIAVELGKGDRAPYDSKKWHSFGKAKQVKNYYEVTFENDPHKLPTLGANGVAIRNSILKKFPIEAGLHTEMCLNFIKEGYNTFAFVKNVHIVHEIYQNIFSFSKRRLQWATLYSPQNIQRGYNVFSISRDSFKLTVLIIKSILIIPSVVRSLKGYSSFQHIAWFLHPLIVLIFVIAYGIQVLTNIFHKFPILKNKSL